MSIHKTKYGTYQVKWRDSTGKQCSKNFEKKLQAEVWESQITLGTARTESPKDDKITFEAYSALWLETYATTHKTASSVFRDRQIIRDYFLPRPFDRDHIPIVVDGIAAEGFNLS